MRKRTRSMLGVALTTVLTLALCSTALAVHSTPESWQAMTGQVDGGKVAAALVVPQKGEVRVRLKDGTHYTASYPSGGEQSAISTLRSHGASVTIHKTPKSSGHVRYRYIALAILALGALAALGYYLLRGRPATPPPDAGAPAAGPPAAGAPPGSPAPSPGAGGEGPPPREGP